MRALTSSSPSSAASATLRSRVSFWRLRPGEAVAERHQVAWAGGSVQRLAVELEAVAELDREFVANVARLGGRAARGDDRPRGGLVRRGEQNRALSPDGCAGALPSTGSVCGRRGQKPAPSWSSDTIARDLGERRLRAAPRRVASSFTLTGPWGSLVLSQHRTRVAVPAVDREREPQHGRERRWATPTGAEARARRRPVTRTPPGTGSCAVWLLDCGHAAQSMETGARW